ncbi:hypothetical protein BD310DRAFT_962407 [Dichomitus squalens]|uniref:Uncharacterized protein n=1 Tax=Dichomitus squalens TaxID=114155 RepID=A0A4Q9PDL3_9APHY|nr:hypothetical protein BD310DRAFT_962407 [Dichomitus squalens]
MGPLAPVSHIPYCDGYGVLAPSPTPRMSRQCHHRTQTHMLLLDPPHSLRGPTSPRFRRIQQRSRWRRCWLVAACILGVLRFAAGDVDECLSQRACFGAERAVGW